MGAEVRVFGSIRVTLDGRTLEARDFGGRKPKQLLEILVLSGGRHVAKDRLAHLLWGEDLPRHAAGSLEHYVSLLRRRLAPAGTRTSSVIVTDHGGYRFDTSRGWVDLVEFDALADAALAAADRSAIERALALVTGDLLEDEPYSDWAQGARRDNEQRRLQLHVTSGELALASGDEDCAATHARAALALDRLHEAAVRLLMIATYRAGEQTQALRTFDEFRRALATDVGADPMPETRALHEAVLRQAAPGGSRGAVPAPVAARRLGGDRPVAGAHRLPERLGTAGALLGSLGSLPAQRHAPVLTGPPPSGPATDAPGHPAVLGTPGSAPAGRSRLVGREADLADCLALHAESLARPGLRSVVVDGELGAGKTALLDELARRLAGQRVVRVTCGTHTRSVDGSLLQDVLHDLVATDVAHAVLDSLGGDGAGERPPTLSVLRRLDAELAAGGPFVVLVDDAHLADERSLLALAALGGPRPTSHGTVVLAADLGRAPHGCPLYRYAPDLRLDLAPLTRQHLLELGVPDLHDRTGGLPLLVAGCRTEADGSLAADVAERVLATLRAADEPTWRVLVACAMAAPEFGIEEVARLAGTDVLETAEVQDRLCFERVLRTVGLGYRFRYPLVRDVVRDAVSAGRRRVLQMRVRSGAPEDDRRASPGTPPGGRERRCGADRRQAPCVGLAPDVAVLVAR